MTDDALTRGADPAYREALLERLGDADPVDELALLFERLPAALEGLDNERVTRPEAEGKWSILQVVCHLADAELMQAFRIRRALTEERPVLAPMDQDVWAHRLDYAGESLAEALDQLRALRVANLRLVRRLPDETLDRTTFHPERGEETVRTILAVLAGHDRVHLDQIARIRRTLEREEG
ncbi:MAG: DinB family protein [Gemmatimonadota bacterium]|nr:DinB family protein [Gemmatimonadota bacterium]